MVLMTLKLNVHLEISFKAQKHNLKFYVLILNNIIGCYN